MVSRFGFLLWKTLWKSEDMVGIYLQDWGVDKFGDKLVGGMVGVGAVRMWSCGFGVFILQLVSKKTTH